MAGGRTIIVLGDKNPSGGSVISGSPDHTIGGKPIARKGDKVDCPGTYPGGAPHGVNPIVEGEDRMPVSGMPVALEGHRSQCGCSLIGSSNASYGGAGAVAAAAPIAAADPKADPDPEEGTDTEPNILCLFEVLTNAHGDHLPIIPTAYRVVQGRVLYQLQVKASLTDRSTGEPAAGQALVLRTNRDSDVVRVHGKSDAKGEIKVTLEARLPGRVHFSSTSKGITTGDLQLTLGSFNPVRSSHSIAVDPQVIPARHRVEITAVGVRWADDRGSAIIGNHIDNFLGAGQAVTTAWLAGGVNGTRRAVKYLGA